MIYTLKDILHDRMYPIFLIYRWFYFTSSVFAMLLQDAA